MPSRGVKPTTVTYNAVLNAMCVAGDASVLEDYVGDLLDAMRTQGIEMTPITYNTAIHAYGLCSHWQTSLRLLAEARTKPRWSSSQVN